MRSIVRNLIIAGAAATALTMAAAPASAACQDVIHQGYGTGAQPDALALARSKWSNSVTTVHGWQWSYWSKATNKTESCINKDASIKLVACTAQARPCELEAAPNRQRRRR